MKDKILHIALAATLVLGFAGCSDSPTAPVADPATYITFSVPQLDFSFEEGSFSRAELVDEIGDFTVWAYCIPRDVSGNLSTGQASAPWQTKSEFFTAGPDVLNGFNVRVNGSDTSYDKNNPAGGASNPKEWYSGTGHPNAKNYNYGFIATSTTAGSFTMSNSNLPEKAHPVITFTLPHENINRELYPEDQPDALIGTKFDQFNNSKVALTFQHIMTGIRFRFHNQTDNSTLTIHRVTFAGEFYRTATFSFEKEEMTGSVSGDTFSATFVLLNSDQSIAAGTSDLMRHDGDPAGRSVKLLLLPNPNATLDPSQQEIDDWALGRQKQIMIEYSINGGAHRTFTTDKDFRLSYIPDPNTLHTANFHFTGDDFVISFVPDNNSMWNNGSDSNLEIH